jgi:hypothetical protein
MNDESFLEAINRELPHVHWDKAHNDSWQRVKAAERVGSHVTNLAPGVNSPFPAGVENHHWSDRNRTKTSRIIGGRRPNEQQR